MKYALLAVVSVLSVGCALSPGKLDPTKIEAVQSCVVVVNLGNPQSGAATATATIPVSALPKLGLLPDTATTVATLPTNEVKVDCKR